MHNLGGELVDKAIFAGTSFNNGFWILKSAMEKAIEGVKQRQIFVKLLSNPWKINANSLTSGVELIPYGNQSLVLWRRNQLAGSHMIHLLNVKSLQRLNRVM